jgi:hypothetical protein
VAPQFPTIWALAVADRFAEYGLSAVEAIALAWRVNVAHGVSDPAYRMAMVAWATTLERRPWALVEALATFRGGWRSPGCDTPDETV